MVFDNTLWCDLPLDLSSIKWILQIGYNYKVTGTTFTAKCDHKPNSECGSSVNSRRRRLLQMEYGNSGDRL